MKLSLTRHLLAGLALAAMACAEDGADGTPGPAGKDGEGKADGLEYVLLTGAVSNDDAAKTIAADVGASTNAILVANTTELTQLDLSGVEKLVDITFVDNKGLERIAMPNLAAVAGQLSVRHNTALTEIQLGNLQNASTIDIAFNNGLSDLGLPLLAEVETLSLERNGFETIRMPRLAKAVVDLRIVAEPQLGEISFPELATAGRAFVWANPQLDSITWPALRETGRLIIRENDALARLALPQWAATETTTITENKALLAVDAPALATLAAISITRNPALAAIDMAALRQATVQVIITGNDALPSLALPNLVETNTLFLSGASIATASLPSLVACERIRVQSELVMETLDLSSLQAFNELLANNQGGLAIATMTALFSRLVAISPGISNKVITTKGSPSAQALADAQALRASGNTVTISP